jgi:hypothetical protein
VDRASEDVALKKWQKVSSAKERRVFERSIVLVRASLETEHGELRVFLRNLSRSGALIDASEDLQIGEVVTLNCGKSSVPARIVWAKRPRFGLAFRDLISDTEVQRHVTAERSRPPTRGRPPSSRREQGRVVFPDVARPA